MNDDDPFLDLLQGALEMPDDLSLGSEGRARLLAAAAESAEPEKVVAFPVASSTEREGFEWLAGERRAGNELLEKIIGSPALLATLEQERIFLGHLRRVMRRPEVAATSVAPRSMGWRRPVYTLASVAALLLISAVPVWRSVSHRSSSVPTVANAANVGAQAPSMDAGPNGSRHPDERKRISSGTTEGGAGIVENGLPSSVVAGGGSSFAADDPDWTAFHEAKQIVSQGDVRTLASNLLMAADTTTTPAGDPSLAAADDFPTGSAEHALAANDTRDRSTGGYLPGMNMNFRTDNDALFSPGGTGGDLSIPEPSGGVPVMVGFMVLLLHRFRRRLPKVHQPIRP